MRLGGSNSLIQDIDRGGVRPLILWREGDRTIEVYDRMLTGRKCSSSDSTVQVGIGR
jgi:hypothetical protein